MSENRKSFTAAVDIILDWYLDDPEDRKILRVWTSRDAKGRRNFHADVEVSDKEGKPVKGHILHVRNVRADNALCDALAGPPPEPVAIV